MMTTTMSKAAEKTQSCKPFHEENGIRLVGFQVTWGIPNSYIYAERPVRPCN